MWHMSLFKKISVYSPCETFCGEDTKVRIAKLLNLLALTFKFLEQIQRQIMSGSFFKQDKNMYDMGLRY